MDLTNGVKTIFFYQIKQVNKIFIKVDLIERVILISNIFDSTKTYHTILKK